MVGASKPYKMFLGRKLKKGHDKNSKVFRGVASNSRN
jgi:hypothetical protein